MTIILFLLAIGAAVLAISMIVMWYVMMMGVIFAGFVIGAVYWITFMLVDGVTHDPQISAVMGVIAVLAVFVGIGYLGMQSNKNRAKKNSK